MSDGKYEILAAAKAMLEKADDTYGVGIRDRTSVSVDIKGKNAGEARMYPDGSMTLRFNQRMTVENFSHIHDDTVPHEVAHLVCFANPRLGRKHDAGWKRVCRELGGTGHRCHDNEVIYAKGKTYRYYLVSGATTVLSEARHKKIQSGWASYKTKNGNLINNKCAYEVIGIRGQRVENNCSKPVRQAAQSNKAPNPQNPKTGSKKEQAYRLLVSKQPSSRKEAIDLLMIEVGMTKAGAGTYYQQLKHHIT